MSRILMIAAAVLFLPAALCLAFWSLVAALVAFGISLIIVGAFGIWLAMVSPVQLQPIPLIMVVVGIVLLFGVAVAT